MYRRIAGQAFWEELTCDAELKSEFSAPDGSIDWEKLIAFNSSKEKPKNSKFVREIVDDEYQPSLL